LATGVKKGVGVGEPAAAGRPLRKPPSPSRCPQFVRREIADALPEICKGLVAKAKKGEAAALKLLWQMAGLDKPADKGAGRSAGIGARELGFARRAMEKFRAR
jgi:hypothetical protein